MSDEPALWGIQCSRCRQVFWVDNPFNIAPQLAYDTHLTPEHNFQCEPIRLYELVADEKERP